MKTSQEIRQAMIQIADKNQRPHYTQIVVRAVIHAVKNDLDHPLKSAVLAEKLKVVQIVRPKGNLDVLKGFCATRGMMKFLAKHSKLSESYIQSVLRQDSILSNELFEKFKSAFTRAETDFQNSAKQTKGRTHGTVNCYQEGCRCLDCKSAKQEQTQARLRQITEKYVGAAA